MAIWQSDLLRASARRVSSYSSSYGKTKGFLCHSHKDRDLAQGLQQLLKEQGLDLYIDWQDSTMPDKPSAETAERIQGVIRQSSVFLILATQNSSESRWCPWEIGYADGCSMANRMAIVQTIDNNGIYHGSEYLGLYRRIDMTGPGGVYWFAPGSSAPRSLHVF